MKVKICKIAAIIKRNKKYFILSIAVIIAIFYFTEANNFTVYTSGNKGFTFGSSNDLSNIKIYAEPKNKEEPYFYSFKLFRNNTLIGEKIKTQDCFMSVETDEKGSYHAEVEITDSSGKTSKYTFSFTRK